MKTKLISFFLLTVILLSAVPTVQAETEHDISFYEIAASYENAVEKLPQPSVREGGSSNKEKLYLTPEGSLQYEADILQVLDREIKEAILNGESSLDISKYNISPKNINLQILTYYSPYISNGINISCWGYADSDYEAIDITCPMTKKEVEEYFAKVDDRIAEIDALLAECPTDLDKILFIHDYLIYTGQYDYDNLLNGSVPSDSYRSAGLLMNGMGVCQSYSNAIQYFLHKNGIECHIVSSEKMNHQWNVVKLGESYYHIDATWDDPIRDKLGRVAHSHFLLSDSAISETRGSSTKNHHSWNKPELVCGSTVYDDAFWVNTESFVYTVGSNMYYIRNESIVRHNPQNGKEKIIKEFDYWYTNNGKGYWIGSYSGLWKDGTRLYYNSYDSIGYIDVTTLEDKTVFSPDFPRPGDLGIFGSAVINGVLYYDVKDNPNEVGTIKTIPLENIMGEKEVNIIENRLTLKLGETSKLNVAIMNSFSETTLIWSSDDTLVATVDNEGNVTAVGKGSTNITVTSENGSKDKCPVTVTSDSGEVETDSAKLFDDVKKSSWFKTAVDFAVDRGLMNGTSSTRFEPNASMNRAMLVTVLWRLEGSPEPDENVPFTDLKQAWYRDAVAWAYSNEIVNGTSATAFSPNSSITREQMAAILYRYSAYKNYDTTDSADLSVYPDGKRVSSYAKASMSWANGAGLITGKPSGDTLLLTPRGNATRAEVATILLRYLENIAK